MKRSTLATTTLTLLVAAIAPPALQADAVNFDQLRRENLERYSSKYEELRRGYQDGIKALNFDELRRENLDTDATLASV